MTSVFSAEGRNTSVVSPKAIAADPLVSAKTRLEWLEEKIGLEMQYSCNEGTIQNSLKMPCSGSRVLPEADFKKRLAWSLLRGCVRAEGRETV